MNKDPGRRLIGKSRRWTLALVVVAVQMASVSLSEIDFRSSVNPGLVISQDRISPAWSAYEDCQSDWGEIHLPALVLAGEPLFAGGRSVSNSEINQWVAGPEALTSPSPQSLPPEPEPLRGMIISQSGNSDNDTTQLALSGDADRGGTSENLGARLVVGSQVADVNDSFISSLGEEFFSSAKDSGDSIVESTFAERAQKLVQEELNRRKGEENQRTIPTASGGAVVVARSPQPEQEKLPETLMAPNLSKKSASSKKIDVSSPFGLTSESPVVRPESLGADETSFIISGRFQISGDLFYLPGEMQFELVHEVDGIQVGRGSVWEDEAKFQISVHEFKGLLNLRLVDQKGQVLGLSRMSLQELALRLDQKTNIISDLDMSLVPVRVGAAIDIISLHSIGSGQKDSIPVVKAEVKISSFNRTYYSDEKGRVDDVDWLPGSSFIVRAQHKEYWSSLSIGVSGELKKLFMFPKATVEALLSLVEAGGNMNLRELREKPMIWGRVMRDGKPLTDAVVELAGDQDHAPIYFNSLYLPDGNLSGTGSNGWFAFAGLSPGVQSVRVRIDGNVFPAQIIPTETKYISVIDFSVERFYSPQVKVTSMPGHEAPTSGLFRIVGTEEDREIRDEGTLSIPLEKGITFVEGDGGEGTEILRFALNQRVNAASVPMISSAWLSKMAVEKRINLDGGMGIIIGFVEKTNYEVGLGERESSYPSNEIVYFDRNGKILREGGGRAGGGFIMYNVPAGFHLVTITPQNSDRLFSQVIVAEPAVTSLIVGNEF